MSEDIDMQSYAGEPRVPVAEEQQGDNFYLQETEDASVDYGLMDGTKKAPEPVVDEKPEVNPQAENFRAFREEVEALRREREAEKREHAIQMEMFKANQQRERAPDPTPKKMFEDMRDDDVPNVRELRQEWEQRESNYQARLEELQIQQQFPDYNEVLQKYVVPLLQQKPILADGIHKASNKALFAYELGKMAQQMQQTAAPVYQSTQAMQPTPPSTIAQKIVDNAKKPGTLSQAGGQGALSKADYYASMSDKQFNEMASKNLEGI